MELFVWRNIGFELPEDWELLQFARDPKEGRCAFADRYQFRLEYGWVRAAAAPDLKRMLSDYETKMRDQEGLQDLIPLHAGAWQGFGGRQKKAYVSRYVRHLSEAGYLLELVFIHPDERQAGLEQQVVKSAGVREPGAGLECWRAFGMNVQVPAGLEFSGANILPARAELMFISQREGSSWVFHRLGMLPLWLKESVEEYLRRMLSASCAQDGLRIEQHTLQGHDIVTLAATETSAGLLLKRRQILAQAWICPKDGRLYSFTARLSGTDVEKWAAHLHAGAVLDCCLAR